MTAFTSHFAFEFKTGLRNPTAMLMNYLFPLGFYAMMGLVMTQINPGFKDVLVPALVIFAIMASNLLGLPGPLVDSARRVSTAPSRSMACQLSRSFLSRHYRPSSTR